jgi:hypothetical protein
MKEGVCLPATALEVLPVLKYDIFQDWKGNRIMHMALSGSQGFKQQFIYNETVNYNRIIMNPVKGN